MGVQRYTVHDLLGQSHVTYPPWSRVPVGVVVPLLRAFVASSVSVGVLTGVDGRTDA